MSTLFRIDENLIKNTLLKTLRLQAAVFSNNKASVFVNPTADANLRKTVSELERNKYFLTGLYESLVNGDITEIEYKDMKRSYETKIASLTAQAEQQRESTRISTIETMTQNKAVNYIETLCSNDDLTCEIVNALVEKILVYEDKRIEIHFRFTDEILRMEVAANE